MAPHTHDPLSHEQSTAAALVSVHQEAVLRGCISSREVPFWERKLAPGLGACQERGICKQAIEGDSGTLTVTELACQWFLTNWGNLLNRLMRERLRVVCMLHLPLSVL